ncbi:MAG: hypothetical protein K9L78_04380 [Victivallales bacterium]|nr:hypothetical protein [Victivallales bacterium]
MSKLYKATLFFISAAISSALLSACSTTAEVKEAYNLGAGDTVKRQYWIIQNRQKDSSKKSNYKVNYYKLNSPTDVDGVKFVPHTITVRTVDV